ncbi:MAG: ABC transporter permease [Muribaculaceae bacterium]|nr:ABC transporter permease [Muribaculaceae bacterium]
MQRYFKQAWGSMMKQPLLSIVSIAGTTLAIFLIMIIVMIDEVKVVPFSPESARDRWLVQTSASIGNKEWGSTPDNNSSNGGMSYETIRRTFYEMKTPEATGTFSWSNTESHLSVPGKTPLGARRKDVDHGFFKVMDFSFISGHPFQEADVESGLQVAVINETLARRLFDTTDCEGREFSIDHVPYRVCGVVRDVSNLTSFADADLWVPLTSNGTDKFTWCTYMGGLGCIIVAPSKADFPAVREEYNKVWDKFEAEVGEAGWEFYRRQRPYDQFTSVNTRGANMEPDMDGVRRHNLLVYTILLLIPAINLSSMTQSRLRHRREEIGVRRAFGATKTAIMTEIFIESLVITVIAGIIGLLLSIAFIFLGGKSVLAGGADVTGLTIGMVFNFSVFGIALLFCFLMNLISATLPSWQASRTNIVNALSGGKK